MHYGNQEKDKQRLGRDAIAVGRYSALSSRRNSWEETKRLVADDGSENWHMLPSGNHSHYCSQVVHLLMFRVESLPRGIELVNLLL